MCDRQRNSVRTGLEVGETEVLSKKKKFSIADYRVAMTRMMREMKVKSSNTL